MRVGFIQFTPVLGDIEQNILKICKLVDRTDADLVVLPELYNTGYHFTSRQEVEAFAEEIPCGKTTEILCRLAKTRGAYIIAGLIEKSGDQCYNASVLVGPAGYIATYRTGTETRREKSLHFMGKSQITGPDGSILCRGGEASEEIGIVEIDPTLARNKAINPYNDAFGSRRIEYYGELMKQRPR